MLSLYHFLFFSSSFNLVVFVVGVVGSARTFQNTQKTRRYTKLSHFIRMRIRKEMEHRWVWRRRETRKTKIVYEWHHKTHKTNDAKKVLGKYNVYIIYVYPPRKLEPFICLCIALKIGGVTLNTHAYNMLLNFMDSWADTASITAVPAATADNDDDDASGICVCSCWNVINNI